MLEYFVARTRKSDIRNIIERLLVSGDLGDLKEIAAALQATGKRQDRCPRAKRAFKMRESYKAEAMKKHGERKLRSLSMR